MKEATQIFKKALEEATEWQSQLTEEERKKMPWVIAKEQFAANRSLLTIR